MPNASPKTLSIRKFRSYKLIEIDGRYFINHLLTKTNYIIYKNEKFFETNKRELRKIGFKFKKTVKTYSSLEKKLIEQEGRFRKLS